MSRLAVSVSRRVFAATTRSAAVKPAAQLIQPRLMHARSIHSAITQFASDRRYTAKHEWLQLDEKSVATIGVSDYAQNSLGDIVFIELPDLGTDVEKEVECGTVESVKAASDIYSPVSGTVVEKNDKVVETPQLVNKSPYEQGWLYKVALSKQSEIDELMDEKAYEEYVSKLG